ncbi:MAG: hypothetical protein ACI9AR_000635 [Flavobacteriaceae bacterium]|jgi:hypothetical protein
MKNIIILSLVLLSLNLKAQTLTNSEKDSLSITLLNENLTNSERDSLSIALLGENLTQIEQDSLSIALFNETLMNIESEDVTYDILYSNMYEIISFIVNEGCREEFNHFLGGVYYENDSLPVSFTCYSVIFLNKEKFKTLKPVLMKYQGDTLGQYSEYLQNFLFLHERYLLFKNK